LYKELYNFLIFFILLILTITVILNIRVQDKQFQFAEVSISKSDLDSLRTEISFQDQVLYLLGAIFTFDFGKTESGELVTKHIFSKSIPTIQIAFLSVLWGSIMGLFLSFIAFYQGGAYEIFFSFLAKFILSTPIFIFSIVLFFLLFYKLGILPPGGFEKNQFQYMIMPSIALGSRVASRIYFFSCTELSKSIKSDFVFFFNALGFSRLKIHFYYLPRKIFPMMLTYIVLDLCSLLSGSIIVEDFFFFPGIGKSMFQASKSLDKNLLQGILLYIGILFYCITRFAKNLQTKLLTQE
jgi:peptide/nickel transport system permease protein